MLEQENNFSPKTRVHPTINGILGIISFSTRIPVNRYVTIEEMAGSVVIWPYVGLFIGALAAIIAYITAFILNFAPLLTAGLIYSFLIWFMGFNHLDGVMDMGDGLMVHGDSEKRLSVMRDSMVGTGGIGTFFIVAILTLSALASIPIHLIIPSILIMEMASKFSMISSMVIGENDSKGIGRLIKSGIDKKVLLVCTIINSAVGYIIMGVPGIFAIVTAVLTGLYMAYKANKTFGCVTGDIMGASNEIGRLTSLIMIIIITNII